MCRRTLILKLLHIAILPHRSFAQPELVCYGGHRPVLHGELVNLLVYYRGLQHATDNQHIEWMPLDLASLASVRAFARELAERELPPWAMGTIIRSPGCGEALIRIAQGPQRHWVDFSGTRLMQLRMTQ
jgi:hypothetical protein